MRFIELLLCLLLLLSLCMATWRAMRGLPRFQKRLLPALIVFTLALHLVVEGPRWQLYPVYLLAAVFAWLTWAPYNAAPPSAGHRMRRMLSNGLGVVLVLLCLGVALALPVFRLPNPGGPYAIGTTVFSLEQTDRTDPYAPGDGAIRRFPVQVWYPAPEGRHPDRARWLPHAGAFVSAAANAVDIPAASFILRHLRHVKTHAYWDAPVAADATPFPVVLYSHGWTGWRTVALDQIERLVSHGFVVIAPDHTYGALAAVFPDGEAVPKNAAAMPPEKPEEARQAGIELLVDTYAADLRYLLDQLPALNQGALATPLAGTLALDRVGIFGHSTGAGAVTEVAATDDRVTAALALDPWVVPVSADIMERAIPVPFMSIRSEGWVRWKGDNSDKLARLLEQAAGPTWDMYIEHTGHHDFTLAPAMLPLARFFTDQSERGEGVFQVTNDYLELYFIHFLGAEGKAWPHSLHPEMRSIDEFEAAGQSE
ncbi:MAG: alpha/beta hydrolase family protein [Candidatus Hydrogenedentota bacterium]